MQPILPRPPAHHDQGRATPCFAAPADPRGQEVFDQAKNRFIADANARIAIAAFEAQFKEALKKR